MKTNYEIMLEIKKRPGLYLGHKSFDKFIDFTSGYEVCLHELGLIKGKEIFEGFEDFVKNYYKIQIDKPWTKIIQLFSFSDETAFDEFFRVFDLFLIENPKLLEEENDRQEKYHLIKL